MALKLSFEIPAWLVRVLDSPAVARWCRPELPPVAVEIGSRAIVSVALRRGREGPPVLERHRRVELPLGLVQPSLLSPLVTDLEAFQGLLGQALEGLPGFDGRFSILLPDRVARITMVDLEREAASHSETAELLRWKLKRATPFRVEDSRIAYQGFPLESGGLRCLVGIVPQASVVAVESAATALGYSAGLVDLSTFRLWNLLESRMPASGDALLVNATEDFATLMLSRSRQPLFVRVRAPLEGGEVTLDEIESELNGTLLYYQDRVKGPGLETLWLRAPEPMLAGLQERLQQRGDQRVEPVALPAISGANELGISLSSSLAPALGAAMGN